MGDRAGTYSDVRLGNAAGRDERCDVLHSRCWAILCALFLVVLCSVQPGTAREDPPVVRLLPVEEKELFREQLIARMNAIKAAIQAQEADGSEAEGSDTISFMVGEDQKRLGVVQPAANGDSATTLSVPERSLAYLAHADLSDWEPSPETCEELGPIGEWQLSAGEYSIESVLQLISSRRTALRQKEVCLRLQEERIAALGASAAFDGRCDCENMSVGDTSDGPRWILKAEDEISVVYTVDEYSFPGLGASINSVLKHVSPGNMHRLRFKVLVGRGERELLTNWLYHHLDAQYGAGGGDGRRWPFDVEVKEFTNTNLPPYFVRGPKATRLSKDIVFARFFLDDYFAMDRYIYLDADVIVRRDITELWNAVWGQPEKQTPLQNVLHAFRNCGSGYHHFFDMKNQAVSGRFVPRRCTFESGFYLVNGNGWRENNVTAQLSEWILLNSQVPLYIGAVKAPLMALFYDRYDNIENIANLNWTHATSLGKTTFAAPHVLPEASSLEWTGPLKPWLPNGRSLVKYWEPYAFTDPTFAKYKWEAEDQARKGRDGNGALSTGNSGGYSEILKHVSENVEVGKYLTEQELQELRSLLQIDLALHNSGEFSSSNKLLLLVFGTILVVLFYCLHCGKRQHRYEAMQLARVQYHMRRVRVVKEVTLTLAEESADGQ